MDCAKPSVDTVCGCGHCATPESESLQVNVTFTSVLFQPAVLGAGVPVAETVGGVLSRLTLTVVLADLPASSLTVPVMGWSLPSVETITGGGHEPRFEIEPVHWNVTVTSELFQPEPFGAGLTEALILG